MQIDRKIIDKSDCAKCKGDEPGYSAYCIDCCARLVMSAGRKGADKDLNKLIVRVRNSHFSALEWFYGAPKRKQIEEHILNNYS
jgi:hypothetical protein